MGSKRCNHLPGALFMSLRFDSWSKLRARLRYVYRNKTYALRPTLLRARVRDWISGMTSLGDVESRPRWYSSDNRFGSSELMERSQRPVVEMAVATLPEQGGAVLDLGCGNGALLEKTLLARPGVIPYGIDSERSRVRHAKRLMPSFASNFIHGDYFHAPGLWTRPYVLVLWPVGHLDHANRRDAETLIAQIREHADHVLAYGYGSFRRKQRLPRIAEEYDFELLCAPNQAGIALVRL